MFLVYLETDMLDAIEKTKRCTMRVWNNDTC